MRSEAGELEGLPEPEKTREMALEVGSKASRQAADLLEACAPDLEAHFNSIGKCSRITARKIVEKKWSLSYSIWPKRRFKPTRPKMMAGVSIIRLDRPDLIPWIWCLGGDEAEKEFEHILKERAKVRSHEIDWATGNVGLDRIPILPDTPNGFDVDRESLVAQVRQAFLVFSPPDLDHLWPK